MMDVTRAVGGALQVGYKNGIEGVRNHLSAIPCSHSIPQTDGTTDCVKMNKALIAFAAIVAVALTQTPPSRTPYLDNFVCEAEGHMVVDQDSLCWFHVCVKNADQSLYTKPRRCALGSRVSLNFVDGYTNPCTINFDTVFGYECERAENQPSVDGPPPCAATTECDNGGTAVYESNLCWCQCPPSWQGDADCSMPTRAAQPLGTYSAMCVETGEDEDACTSNPCLNGGVCMDVCKGYWCDCPKGGLMEDGNFDDTYWYGKNCESKN